MKNCTWKGLINLSKFPITLYCFLTLMFYSQSFPCFAQDEKPPINALRISSQIIVGTVGGVLASLAGNVAGNIIVSNGKKGAVVCWPIGVAAGVIGAGELGRQTGSYNMTFIGTVIGTIPFYTYGYDGLGIRKGLIFEKREPKKFKDWVGILSSPVLSTVCFTITRKYKSFSAVPSYDPQNKMIALNLVVKFR